MTDKAGRPPAKPLTITQLVDKQESDSAFLERTNVKAILSTLVDSLYHHQPDDAINYICNYFDNLHNQGDPVKVAHDRLISISYHSTCFDDCLLDIYKMFLKAATTTATSKKAPKVLLADLFNKLVNLLTENIQLDIRQNLCLKLKRKDNDAFSFNYFKASIRLIYICKDFIQESTLLYNELDSYSVSNQVNRLSCELLLDQLRSSLRVIWPQAVINSQTVMQSLYELSPSGLTIMFNEKHSKIIQSRDSIDLETFLSLASKIFIDTINL